MKSATPQSLRDRVKARLNKQKPKRRFQDLAAAVGISPSYLSELLSGKRRMPLSLALKLEEETGLSVRDFAKAA